MTKRASRKKGSDEAGEKVKKAAPAEPFFRPFQKLGKAAGKKGKSAPVEAVTKAKGAPAPAKAAGKAVVAKSPSAPRREAVAPVDADTFALYMAGVRPMDDKGKTRIPATASGSERATPPAQSGDPDAGARERMRALVAEGIRFESLDDGARLDARRVDVDPRDLRRLRRGQFAIDGRLDLHGMSLDEARAAVEAFVRKRSAEGDKVVSIIHGKGKHSPRQQGVLRGEIGAWLSQGRAARHVLAFATAPDEDGGEGALLVLLAR